jgi:hypothetical protein
MSESHQEHFQGLEHLSENRQTERYSVTNYLCGNQSLIHFSNIVQFNSFSLSWTIYKTISNNRMGMGCIKLSVKWVQCHFRGGTLAGEWPWSFVKL